MIIYNDILADHYCNSVLSNMYGDNLAVLLNLGILILVKDLILNSKLVDKLCYKYDIWIKLKIFKFFCTA